MALDPTLRSKVESLWSKLWTGGLANPMDAIDLAKISKAGVTASRQPAAADPLQGLQLAVDAAAPDGKDVEGLFVAQNRILRAR